MTEAHKVIQYLTKRHFSLSGVDENIMQSDLKNHSGVGNELGGHFSLLEKHLSKKFLFFYIAHELIFKSMNNV